MDFAVIHGFCCITIFLLLNTVSIHTDVKLHTEFKIETDFVVL